MMKYGVNVGDVRMCLIMLLLWISDGENVLELLVWGLSYDINRGTGSEPSTHYL